MKIPVYEYVNWKKPGYKTWSVEGGNKAYELNNLGLPGTIVKVDNSSKYIFLLGDSFLEGEQYPGDKIASGIFQSKLNDINSQYQVLNLSGSGLDPYILWFRADFFEKYFSSSYIILFVEDYKRLEFYLNRHKNNVDFSIPENLGTKVEDSFILKFSNLIRKYSAFSNLITESYLLSKYGNAPDDINSKNENNIEKSPTIENKISSDTLPELFKECLIKYKNKYNNKFIFVSAGKDFLIDNELKNFCRLNGINFYSESSLMNAENLINGNGHFNLEGNLKLGNYLSEIFINSEIKN